MNKRLLFVFTLLLFSSISRAQNWAMPGTQWFYSYYLFYIGGYDKEEVVGVDTINSIPCSRVQETSYRYDYVSGQTSVTPGGFWYTYESNGRVYIWDGNSFETLYDWNAQPGDSVEFLWMNLHFSPSGNCRLTGTMYIDSVGTEQIAGMTLHYQDIHFTDPSTGAPGYDRIYERLGSKIYRQYYRYECEPSGIVYEEIFGPLNCYYDPVLGTYRPNGSGDCDWLNVEKMDENTGIHISPNPVSSSCIISGKPGLQITKVEMTDIAGRQVRSTELPASSFAELKFTDEAPGIYFLKVFHSKGFSLLRIVHQ